jgi:hypothetical protein
VPRIKSALASGSKRLTDGCRNPSQRLAEAEADHHLVVPHPLAALDEAEIAYQAIAPAAHAGQATAFEQSEHVGMMHRPAIPSILDGSRILRSRKIRLANKRSTDERCGNPD